MAGFGDFLGGALGYVADDMRTRRNLQLEEERDMKRRKADMDDYEKKRMFDEKLKQAEQERVATTFEEDPETGLVRGFNALGKPIWERKMGPGVQKKMQAALRQAEAQAEGAEFDAEHKDDVFNLEKRSKEANMSYMGALSGQASETARGQRIKNNAIQAALEKGEPLPPALRTGKGTEERATSDEVLSVLDDYTARIKQFDDLVAKGEVDIDPEKVKKMDDARRSIQIARSVAASNPELADKMLKDISSMINYKPKKLEVVGK